MAIDTLNLTTKQTGSNQKDRIARLVHHNTDETGPMLATGNTNPLPVTTASGSNGLVTRGVSYLGTSTVTRGANTTPYTAGDVVGGAGTIANIGVDGMDTLITAVRLMMNITAIPTGMTSFSLHFYNVTPPSAIADNGVFTLGSGDRAAYLEHIDGLTPTVLGIGTVSVQAQLSGLTEQLRLSGSTSLFYYLVTNGGFTPAANSETYTMAVRGLLLG